MYVFSMYGFVAALGLFSLGAVLALVSEWVFRSRSAASLSAHTCAALGSVMGIGFGLTHLFSGETVSSPFPGGVGFVADVISFSIDPLAAFFITAISAVGLAASIYGIGYQKQYFTRYPQANFGFFYNVFIASMLLVVSANNALFFLAAWEAMALASYFLVVFERNRHDTVSAGTLYILMTQLGTVFLFGAFLLMFRYAHSWDFDAMRAAVSLMPAAVMHTTLAFALIGFATKAGVIPLHIWLPEAHPAAPSHVSALMSGVMIKTAIFMIIRFFFDFFPTPYYEWGLIILALGAISSLLGVLYALTEHDIKRLLAYHSVENIGIILLGVGAALVFFAFNIPAAGMIALVGALYHTINHALFKALLFLSAGSVVHATGTRNMEEYGGLIKLMPWTSAFFLIGAVAISGLPPFNGFVSEWLTFQALFAGIAALPLLPKLVFLAGASSLAFTGGLAAACFVKAFGATFLARSRHVHEHVHEGTWSMRIGMLWLAVLCFALGIGASSVVPVLSSTLAGLLGAPSMGAPFVSPINSITLGQVSILSMPAIFVALVIALLIGYIIADTWARRQKVTINRTWDCGADLGPRMEITATGLSRSILVVFRPFMRPFKRIEVTQPEGASAYAGVRTSVDMGIPDIYRTYLYHPATTAFEFLARMARRIQHGNLNAYLAYMFITVIALLVWTLMQ